MDIRPLGLNALADDFTPSTLPDITLPDVSLETLPADLSSQASLQGNGNGALASAAYDPFVTASTPLGAGAVGAVPTNPYSHDATAAALGSAFFPGQAGFQQPVRPKSKCPVD